MKINVLTIPRDEDKVIIYDEKNQETLVIYRSYTGGEEHLVLSDLDVLSD